MLGKLNDEKQTLHQQKMSYENKIKNFTFILKNPSIFEYDYIQMKKNMSILKEELMMKAWHPTRVLKWIENGYEDILE